MHKYKIIIHKTELFGILEKVTVISEFYVLMPHICY